MLRCWHCVYPLVFVLSSDWFMIVHMLDCRPNNASFLATDCSKSWTSTQQTSNSPSSTAPSLLVYLLQTASSLSVKRPKLEKSSNNRLIQAPYPALHACSKSTRRTISTSSYHLTCSCVLGKPLSPCLRLLSFFVAFSKCRAPQWWR